MKKRSLKLYLFILAAIIFFMSISESIVEKTRATFISFFAPAAEIIHSTKTVWMEDEITRLQLENHLLNGELNQLKDLLKIKNMPPSEALPARIIFRPSTSWSHSFWINVGREDNPIVTKNSPVLFGTSVVGVIDFAGKHQSRVRLITDPGLNPSVRAVREIAGEKHYLAKGELQGSIQPIRRSQGYILKGVGFNYDFADEYGPAQDLRSAIISEGDLLETTGMDGVFPSGLQVARVITLIPLKEGDYTYTLTAKPTLDNFDKLNLVFVIPPVGFDSFDMHY